MKGKIFNTQEVQAIIEGNKTMFREVVKTCKQHPNNVCRKVRNGHYGLNLKEDGLFWQPYGGSELQPFPYCDGKLSASNSLDEFCPYQVGQKIFVKESFDYRERYSIGNYDHYTAWKKRPASKMKQEHSRLTLEITDVKVESLADISDEDCKKEGIGYTGGWNGEDYDDGEYYFGKLIESEEGIIEYTTEMFQFCDRFACKNEMFEYAEDAFEAYWNSTHKKSKEKFEANPFVWVVDFKINK